MTNGDYIVERLKETCPVAYFDSSIEAEYITIPRDWWDKEMNEKLYKKERTLHLLANESFAVIQQAYLYAKNLIVLRRVTS